MNDNHLFLLVGAALGLGLLCCWILIAFITRMRLP